MKINRETFRGPRAIFIIYILVSALSIMCFRFIFPGSNAPLLFFSREWRLIRGVLDLFSLFPALALSALVIPFGIVSIQENYKSFSPDFLKRLVVPIINATSAAAIYGIIFFLLLPMAKNYEENLLFKGELYRLAKERAQIHGINSEWAEASSFIDICDQVWPNSPELAALRTEISIHLYERRIDEEDERALAREALAGSSRSWGASSLTASALPGQQQPVDAAQAIAMSEAAFNEGRYFDAHWLATLGGRISVPGGPEAANAARLAGRAWNEIESQAPNRREERLYSLFSLKISGYQAMNSGDWIRAYYIFQELRAATPDDPDAANFLAACERQIEELAFFMDEMTLSLGEILTGAVFSLPVTENGGRAVLRFSSLSSTQDYAYGMGFEYMSFDAQSRPLVSLNAPFAKLLPFTIDGRPCVLVLMRALDRQNQGLSWEPEWIYGSRTAHNRLILGVSYEDFLLLSLVRHGLPNLQIDELFAASKILGSAGYVSQVFQAEILNRFGAAMFFLPMAIIALVIGWRYRARNRPRYFFILMLPVLPVVFHGVVYLYKSILNTAGIWLVLTLGFSTAMVAFIAFLVLSLFLSLILLAAQKG
ncbi:MAG: hypothetical protein FWG99_10740 [Treponema sp.]|nr:hypothetical protein [Treponema sp.]